MKAFVSVIKHKLLHPTQCVSDNVSLITKTVVCNPSINFYLIVLFLLQLLFNFSEMGSLSRTLCKDLEGGVTNLISLN
jgi:hypothetical protein